MWGLVGAACSPELVKSPRFRCLLVSEEAVLWSKCPDSALLRAEVDLRGGSSGE